MYLLVWDVDILKGFSTFSATLLSVVFVFGNSVRNTYEAMLFLFVEHPFDIGDLLELEGFQWRVKQIELMNTVLVKTTGERSYYPNQKLLLLPIVNLTRSTTKSDIIKLLLDVGPSAEGVRKAIDDAVRAHHEENSSDFAGCPSCKFIGMADPFKVQLAVGWSYSFGGDELRRAGTVKAALLAVVNSCLGSAPVEYTMVKEPKVPEMSEAEKADRGLL